MHFILYTQASAQEQKTIIHLTKYGFSPQKVIVVQGTTIQFINDDRDPHWPEGGELQFAEEIKPGQAVDFIPQTIGTFQIDDKLDPSHKGQIVVDQTSFRTPQPQIEEQTVQKNDGGLVAFIIKFLHAIKDFIVR